MSKSDDSVEETIRQAIAKFGTGAVAKATTELTKPKRGARKKPDWPKLDSLLKEDVTDWLNSLDPIEKRSNHSIAVKFANAHPGHDKKSTLARVRSKLGKKDNRRVWGLARAILQARSGHPVSVYLRLLEQMISIFPGEPWMSFHESAVYVISLYRRASGTPTQQQSITDIEKKLTVIADEMAAERGSIRTGLLAAVAPNKT